MTPQTMSRVTSGAVAAAAVLAGAVLTAGPATAAGTASRPQLTAAQAAGYTVGTFLGSWTPSSVGAVQSLPATYSVSGSGSYRTVQSAITAAVKAGGSSRVYIRVAAGTYREVVCVPSGAPPITLYSTTADAARTVIVYGNANPKPRSGSANTCAPGTSGTYGTGGSATFFAFSKGFQAKNLTFANDYVEGTYSSSNQSAVALYAQGDQQVYENVRVLGNQDSLLSYTPSPSTVSRQYFKGGYVEGDVDFIFGRGTAVLDGTEIRYLSARTSSGAVLAPSTAAGNAHGFLVINARLTVSGSASNSVLLGRSWDEGVGSLSGYVNGSSPNGQAVIRNSTIAGHIKRAAPWGASTVSRPFCSSGCAHSANRFAEYADTGPGAG